MISPAAATPDNAATRVVLRVHFMTLPRLAWANAGQLIVSWLMGQRGRSRPAATWLQLKAGPGRAGPGAPGEVHGPLDYAPAPGLASSLFDDAVLDAHLDHLARAQRDDGGWTFSWMAWSPAAEQDWRGARTVDALQALRAYGRV